jgi:hypothetical protein
MKSIRTEIVINARPERVWRVLTNFAAYPEWNPFIIRVEGAAIAGSRLRNTMQLEGQKEQIFRPKVLEVVPGKSFRWEGHLFFKGLFDGEHYFLLEALEEGATRLVHGENFRGILAGPLLRMIGKQTREGFLKMNEALKERCEQLQ